MSRRNPLESLIRGHPVGLVLSLAVLDMVFIGLIALMLSARHGG